MESSNQLVNVVVWAENQEEAAKLAAGLTKGVESPSNVFSGNVEGVKLKAYLRHRQDLVSASPVGITDILIVLVSGSSSSYLSEAKSYINLRKAIPFKFVTSSEDLSELAKELESEYINVSEITSDSTVSKMLKSAKNLD